MGTINHVATEGEAAQGVFYHVVYGVQLWVGAFKSGSLAWGDGADLKGLDIIGVNGCPINADISE